MHRLARLGLVGAIAAAPLDAAAPLAQGQTWIVGGTGGDFPTIQLAIDAASDGDTIVVRPSASPVGNAHAGFTVSGKSLTIQGEDMPLITGFNPFIMHPGAPLTIQGIPSGKSVTVRGMRFEPLGLDQTPPSAAAVLNACEGPIVLEDVAVVTRFTVSLEAHNCDSVTLTRSTVESSGPVFDIVQGVYLDTPAVFLHESAFFLHDSEVKTDDSPDAAPFGVPPPDGSVGVDQRGGLFFAQGSTIRGGSGGSATAQACFAGADGASALRLSGGSTTVPSAFLRDTILVPGAGGVVDPVCGLPDGAPGAPFEALSGTVAETSKAGGSFHWNPIVAAGGGGLAEYDGEPGDLTFLAYQVATAAALLDLGLESALHFDLTPPSAILFQGALDAAGKLGVAFVAPALGGSATALPIIGQGIFVGSDGLEVRTSGPSLLVVLHAGL